jgi:hypothetical protein
LDVFAHSADLNFEQLADDGVDAVFAARRLRLTCPTGLRDPDTYLRNRRPTCADRYRLLTNKQLSGCGCAHRGNRSIATFAKRLEKTFSAIVCLIVNVS